MELGSVAWFPPMHPILVRLRNLLRSRKFDFVRYYPVAGTLEHFGIKTVLDVGANVGQYASMLRAQGYAGRILSFEPVAASYAQLKEAAKGDPLWEVFHHGLGAEDASAEMFIEGSSSMNSMLRARQDMPLMKNEIHKSRQVVEIRRLDSIFDSLCGKDEGIFLKIDTQGFELDVLKGAEKSMPRLTGLELELSLTPLYQNQTCLPEVAAHLYQRGFKFWSIERGIADAKSGETYEVEGIFIRA